MNFIAALRTFLLTDEEILAATGTTVQNARIYCGMAPQKVAAPYVVISLVSEGIRFGVNDDDGQQDDIWQIDTWSQSFDTSEGLSTKIRNKIHGLKNQKLSNFKVYSITQESRQMMTEPEGSGTEAAWMRFSADYTIVRDTAETI